MLVKRTSKNQITLPKKIADQFLGVEYFQVTQRGTSIILEPLEPSRADEVREQLAKLGIDEDDVARAVTWARERES